MNTTNNNNSIIVEDYITKKYWAIGDQYINVSDFLFSEGKITDVFKSPENYLFEISYDCPYLIPLDDLEKGVEIKYKNSLLEIYHIKKQRNQAEFSTLDILTNPSFSSIKIKSDFKSDYFKNDNEIARQFEVTDIFWELINHVNFNINNFVNQEAKIDFSNNRILSYRVTYFSKQELSKPIAWSIIPYTSLKNQSRVKQQTELLNESSLQTFLLEKQKLKEYYESTLDTTYNDNFSKTLFKLVFDFAFYSSENPEAISNLGEELIRDLLLIPIRMFWFTAEAEVYNFDGKLDFKITNPENKYESICGELKIWRGQDSFDDCYKQITEKHSSGNETEVYILMINRNRDVKSVYEKCLNGLKSKNSFMKTLDDNISLSKSQFFSKHLVNIKGIEIPLVLGIINVYHEKV